MEQYCVSSLISIRTYSCAETQNNAGRIVLDPVATHESVNANVDARMITNLMKHQPVHNEIRNGFAKKEVIEFATEKIKREVVPKIIPFMIEDTYQAINDLLKTVVAE